MLSFINTWDSVKIERRHIAECVGYLHKEHIASALQYRFYPIQGIALSSYELSQISEYMRNGV